MSWSLRRVLGVVLAVGSLAAMSFLQVGFAQPVPQPKPGPGPIGPGDPTEFSESIRLPRDNQLASKIEAAQDYINTEDWKQATELLQRLIEIPADVFAQLPRKGPDGKETKVWTSVRGEAKRMVANLPRKGMDFYKVTYGNEASNMLARAKETADPAKLAEVMRRFLYTDAGGEATDLLATYYLDRGDYTAAALCFKRLLERDGVSKIEKNVLFKSAYAFHQVGDQKNEDEVWKELANRGGAVRLGERNVSTDELQRLVGGLARSISEFNRTTWPIFGGNSSRNGKAEGDTAFMEARWRKDLITFETSRDRIKSAMDYLVERQQPILSSSFPITASITRDGQKIPLVVFRSYGSLHAHNVKTGQRIWEARSNFTLDSMLRDLHKVQYAEQVLSFYLGGTSNPQVGRVRPTILFDNSTIGTLSSDNTHVYVIDDLAIPPQPTQQGNVRPGMPSTGGSSNPALDEALKSSRLQAFSINTGKLVWEQGGNASPAPELKESYFLGPPLPVAGKLYSLVEKDQELKLVELDGATGRLIRLQPLATTTEKMSADINRRINAAHLSYGEGMLICPTNAGAVLCIDVLENSLVWAYPYQENKGTIVQPNPVGGIRRPQFPGGIGPDGQPIRPPEYWRATAPIILGGKVYFTAPDAQSIHCVNLADGSRVWAHRRTDDDLYMAGVYSGKVLIVGRRSIRAIDAVKGEVLWTVPTGMPSGMGICSDNIYYLPLREGVEHKEPEIVAIDLERGAVHAHTKSRKKEVPGNLIFFEGDVVSQTATEVAVYPQLRVKLAQIDERIKADPNDPIGLVERGELRLDRGDLAGAVADLNKALQQPSIPKELVGKAREKLFETLTDFLQRDFAAAEKYLDTYKDLCKVEIPADATPEARADLVKEERRRNANFLCLVAKGRESKRQLVEAFELYQQFAGLAGNEDKINVVDEPTVQAAPDVWTAGRITAMMAGATEAERKPLEDKVRSQWDAMKASADIAALRKFVSIFGSRFPAGKEARLLLAEKLIESTEPDAMFDAERHLSLLRGKSEDPVLAGRAIEALSRLYTRKGLLDDAAYFSGLLGRQYPTTPLADGRTGADVYNDLATDKRFLPQLDRMTRIPAATRWKNTEERNSYPLQGNTYLFEQQGEELPFFERWQLAMRMDVSDLKLLDRFGSDEKREERPIRKLEGQTFIQNITSQLQTHAHNNRQYLIPRLGYRTLGHLAILQLGPMVYAVDPVGKRVLWEKNLLQGASLGTPVSGIKAIPMNLQFGADPDGTPNVQFQEGFVQRLGTPALMDDGVVCLQTRDSLVGVDPITGRVLWTRSDVRSTTRLFCDDGHIFAVEMSPTGTPALTRVFRLADGVAMTKIPDFAVQYGKKNSRLIGRNILYVDQVAGGGQTAALYDPLKGETIWTQKLMANAIVLQSVTPHLFGAIEFDPATPEDGKLTVTDLRTGKKVLDGKVQTRHFEKMVSIALLGDGKDYFVVGNGAMDANVANFNQGNTWQPPILLNQGMRALPVNGRIYCFNGETGKRAWIEESLMQYLILDRFDEMPLLLMASRANLQSKAPGQPVQNILAVKAINKKNGKLEYRNDSDQVGRTDKTQPIPQGMTFHQLNINPSEGRFDFVGFNLKIAFQADPEAK